MKNDRIIKKHSLVIALALCLIIITACSKEGDGTHPLAESGESTPAQVQPSDQATKPLHSGMRPESTAVGMHRSAAGDDAADAVRATEAADYVAEKIDHATEGLDHTAESETSAMTSPVATNTEINGTVLSTQNGYVLFAETSEYRVLGKDLADYVNKNVKITGTLEELGEKQYLHASSVEVVEVMEE